MYLGYSSHSLQNQIHVAMFTLAAGISPYLNQRELQSLGSTVPLPTKDGIHQDIWRDEYHQYLPHLFPVRRTETTSEEDYIDRYEGSDRAIHTVQHTFICHEYLYAEANDLPERNRIPRGLTFILNFNSRNPEEKARRMSFILGNIWEGIETKAYLEGHASLDERGEPIPTGYLDAMVTNDLTANSWGADLGVALSDPHLSQEGLNRIIQDMNDEKRYISK